MRYLQYPAHLFFPLVGLVLVLFATGAAGAQEVYREWSSKKGTHKIEATIVGKTLEHVTLKRKNGKEIDVEIASLSEPDQAFIAHWRGAGDNVVGKIKTKTKPLVSGAKPIKFPRQGSWNVTLTELSPSPSSPIAIQLKESLGSLRGSVLISPKRTMAAIFQPKTPRGLTMNAFQLKNGKQIGGAFSLPDCTPIDFSPSNRRLAVSSSRTRSQFGPKRLTVLQLGNTVQTLASFFPYGEQGILSFAQFVDDDHLVTVSAEGLMGLWDITRLKLIWKTEIWPGSRPGLSPDRKTIFAQVENGLAAIVALTGDCTSLMACDVYGVKQFSVNAKGTKLVGVGCGSVRQWDIKTGKLVSNFAISAIVRDGSVAWIDDRYLLVGTSQKVYDLIDLRLQCSVWTYLFQGGMAVDGEGKVWAATNQERRVFKPQLTPLQLPHPAAIDAIGTVSGQGIALFDYKGDVPFSLQGDNGVSELNQARENGVRLFETSGFEAIRGAGSTQFVGELSPPKGDGLSNANSSLLLKSNGTILWRVERDYFVFRRPGQTLAENPWKGMVIPQTFRILKPVLNGSTPTSDNGFVDLNYYRDYSEGFAQGWRLGDGDPRSTPPSVNGGRPTGPRGTPNRRGPPGQGRGGR